MRKSHHGKQVVSIRLDAAQLDIIDCIGSGQVPPLSRAAIVMRCLEQNLFGAEALSASPRPASQDETASRLTAVSDLYDQVGSYAAVAEQLGISASRARSLVLRAKRLPE